MQRYTISRIFAIGLPLIGLLISFLFFGQSYAGALNVHTYSDLITDSAPNGDSNHTFTFEIKQPVSPGGHFEFDFPAGFDIPATGFGVRNVEMYVDGTPRTATATLSATTDQVIITPGDGGSIRYNLNTTIGVLPDSDIEFRIGNHTTNALKSKQVFSTSTGTTTVPGDAEPIGNPSYIGNQEISMTVGGVSETTYADFLISIHAPIVMAGLDTTEEIPPFRFNGAPSGEIGGTTQFVDLSLETDEFAICRLSQTPSTTFAAMTITFDDTGLVVHTHQVAVVPDTLNTYYVRCIDDEGNFNIDDFIISFIAPTPTGEANEEDETEGDGSGSGSGGDDDDDGSGSTGGGSSGGGSGGGGSGGGSGDDDDEGGAGGGFESNSGPYPSGDAQVIIRGHAFPGSEVQALVDGFADDDNSVTADSDGSFEITIEEIARGVYTFGVYAIDDNDVRSSTFSTSFTVTGGKTSNLSNINIMPSILVEPDPVDVGAPLTISGYSIPDAEVTLENQKDGTVASLKEFTTNSDEDGFWSIDVDTSRFSVGTYKARARAENSSVSTDFSDWTYYGVGQEATGLFPDLNRDGFVNLIDFSILLFWWATDGGNSDPPADINRDGNVSLTDFSILLFNWTG